VPAILAEAHEVGADGQTMIAAYVAGYEIWAELIRRDIDSHHGKGWHPSAIFGTIAAAGASVVLRGLDANQATHAIGIAASLAGGVVANFGSMTKPFQVGRAAQSGLSAARWAQRGMTASPDAIEHDLGLMRAISPRGSVDVGSGTELGTAWRILSSGLNIKLYPICYAAHRALDAMIELRGTTGFVADEIETVEVELGDTQAAMLRNHSPKAPIDAKFSLEFAMAAGAIAGRCSRSELISNFIQRRDVQDFFGKVTTTTTKAKSADEQTLSPFDRVRIAMLDGRKLTSKSVSYPRGHFKNPVDIDALARKFQDCVSHVISVRQAEQLFTILQNLQDVASISDLMTDEISSSIASYLDNVVNRYGNDPQ
jgi:2-methylcitrate dehydratase PrpD